jgi:predicted dehydrogenase
VNPTIRALGRRLRLGVVGGGPGSFIGPVHRAAARLDDRYEIVAAVLSSNAERSKAAARDIGIAKERAYADWREMLAREAARDDGIDVVAIMTPNDSHVQIAEAALDAGLDVICDKPLATSLAQAIGLVRKVHASGLVFCLTYNYSAYPMVRQARAMVRAGAIGPIRQVQLEYVQPQRATLIERERSAWRFKPAKMGPSLVLGDIGTHAHHLGGFVTGLDLDRVMADVGAVVPERTADDTAHVLLRYENGARGALWVTQAGAGAEHGLSFRIFGATGGLEWHQEQPNQLLHRRLDDFPRLLTRRIDGQLTPEATRAARVEIGHPEGYQEAFATLYREAADAIVARRTGASCDPLSLDFPTVLDGAKGMKFIEAALESSRMGQWMSAKLELRAEDAP